MKETVLLIFVLLATASAQEPPAGTQEALLGFDAVLLIEKGEEILGDEEISLTRNGFWYLFTSEENKALFEKNPERYEIQLGGLCARMGGIRSGLPDNYLVYKDRIYIFSSYECLDRFSAAPEKFLKPDTPQVVVTPESERKGKTLIEKAVQALGGTTRLDAIKSYQEKGFQEEVRAQGKVRMETTRTFVFPDRFRAARIYPSFGEWAVVLNSDEAFMVMPRNIRSMNQAQRANLKKEVTRTVLTALRARNRQGFKVAALGTAQAETTTVERVWVELDGIAMTLGVDPATGQVRTLSYLGRGPSGEYGEIVKTFSDFRVVDGFRLPFKTTAMFNGEPDESFTAESIGINIEIDELLFEKPGSEEK